MLNKYHFVSSCLSWGIKGNEFLLRFGNDEAKLMQAFRPSVVTNYDLFDCFLVLPITNNRVEEVVYLYHIC